MIATLALAAALVVPQSVPHPVRWLPSVAPPGRAALEKASKGRPQGLLPDDGLDDHDEKGRLHLITTCEQYAKAKKAGWSAENNSQIAHESFFIKGCDVPAMLLAAKPSRVSYLEDFRLDAAALDVLPPAIATLADDNDAQEAAEKKGASLRQYAPDLKVRTKDTHDDVLVVEDDDYLYDLELAGFGDFNGDGIEDVLIFQSSYALHGSMHVYEPVILTRTAPGGRLSAIGAK